MAYQFLHHMLHRFGGHAEVVTELGSEFKGEFTELLVDHFIDQHTISAKHRYPQANGLAERCVQTLKSSLTKMIEGGEARKNWDQLVAYVALGTLGYRVSPQKSTGISPYQMLYAQLPQFQVAIRDKSWGPIDLNNEEKALKSLRERARMVAEHMVEAGQGLRVA